MKDSFELTFNQDDRTIQTIYQEGVEDFAESLGGSVTSVCRASIVEWETGTKESGWTVRSAADQELALRWCNFEVTPIKTGDLVFFKTRAEALAKEEAFFRDLVPQRKA